MNIYKGKTLEEALANASQGEDASIEVLTYSVVEEVNSQFAVLVYELRDVIVYASDYLKKIIEGFGLEVEIKEAFKDGIINLTINTNHNSILIGKNGRTLQALNELARNIINYKFKKHYRILLDISDYKDEKYERLVKIAKRVAREVKESRGSVRLDPMPPDERRVIHNALSQYDHIETHSDGTGNRRHIIISYKK